MASEQKAEPVPQAAAVVGKPPLVCAPCWICLEDGPDEAGEPLVRDCACRGETSAGYHISCIIKYATSKTLDVIRKCDRGKVPVTPDFTDYWDRCPNCNQSMASGIRSALSPALWGLVEGLSDIHFVKFHAWLYFAFSSGKQVFEQKLWSLFKLVESRTEAIGQRWGYGSDTETAFFVAAARLHRVMGNLKDDQGDMKQARYHLEQACIYYSRLRNPKLQREWKWADTSLSTVLMRLGGDDGKQEKELRKLVSAAKNRPLNENEMKANILLANILLEKNPPEYFEAIKLMTESLKAMNQILGPENAMTLHLKGLLDRRRGEYMETLRQMRDSS